LQKDFFELNLKYDNKNIVIGNPPFGYKAKLAIDFINKSLDFSDIVIFILPIQFRRWLTQKQVREDAKLLFELPKLEQNSFIYKDKPYNVNCLVQV
jgi:predicted RNA methylase